MTEHFHHVDNFVHPENTKYGIDPVPICPCINVGVGPVSSDWAFDAKYVGREILNVEYIEMGELMVDHFVKGVRIMCEVYRHRRYNSALAAVQRAGDF